MTLSALLVCTDAAATDVLCRVLDELNVRVETCDDFPRAGIRIAQQRFDVIIVDGQSANETLSLLKETRISRQNDSTLAVAVVPSQKNMRELFSLGVNFVLYKPVAYDRALSSLRAARAVMRKEKRKNARAAVHTHATVDYANVEQQRATLVDLAQDGMAVLFGKKNPSDQQGLFSVQTSCPIIQRAIVRPTCLARLEWIRGRAVRGRSESVPQAVGRIPRGTASEREGSGLLGCDGRNGRVAAACQCRRRRTDAR